MFNQRCARFNYARFAFLVLVKAEPLLCNVRIVSIITIQLLRGNSAAARKSSGYLKDFSANDYALRDGSRVILSV